MTGNKDIPLVRNSPSGDGHYFTYRPMTASELVEREARQNAYEAMVARQDEYMRRRQHGELEAYRASDGSHLGSFDHKTGEQLDPPKKNFSIKKYL